MCDDLWAGPPSRHDKLHRGAATIIQLGLGLYARLCLRYGCGDQPVTGGVWPLQAHSKAHQAATRASVNRRADQLGRGESKPKRIPVLIGRQKTTARPAYRTLQPRVLVDVPQRTGIVQRPTPLKAVVGPDAVSYTHLTLPTTPYV